MATPIYTTSGKYVAFLVNDVVYRADGRYAGVVVNDAVYNRNGRYVGQLWQQYVVDMGFNFSPISAPNHGSVSGMNYGHVSGVAIQYPDAIGKLLGT